MDTDDEKRLLNKSKASSTSYLSSCSSSSGDEDGYTVAGAGASLRAVETRRRMLKSSSQQISMLAAVPKDDVGKLLLDEVKKMQDLLQQSGDSLLALELEKLEQQQHMEMLAQQLRQKSENEERLKEELWNLELAKQELSQQVDELTQNLNKSIAEQARMERQESETARDLEQLKAAQAGLIAALEQNKQEYEQDIITLRRKVTLLKREKKNPKGDNASDRETNQRGKLQTSMAHGSKAQEPAAETSKENGEIAGNGDVGDATRTSDYYARRTGASNEESSKKRLLMELETVKASLEHAQNTIGILEEKLQRERQERTESKKLLLEAQEMIETLQQSSQQQANDISACRALPCSSTGMSLGEELQQANGHAEAFHNDDTQQRGNAHIVAVDKFAQTDKEQQSVSLQKNNASQDTLQAADGNIHVYHTRYVRQRQSEDTYGNKALVSPARLTAFNFDPAFMDGRGAAMGLSQSALISSSGAANLIPAVTRTMIGEWVYKYTRKRVVGGISEKRHRRFFWIHPYTRTLYWDSKEPGVSGRNNAKSAVIVSFSVLINEERGAHQSNKKKSEHEPPSLLIVTPKRNIKFQCLDDMGHVAWMKALNYLVAMNEEQQPDEQRKSISSRSQMKVIQEKSRPSLIRQTKQGLAIGATDKRFSGISISSGGGEFELSYPFYEMQFNNKPNSSRGDYTQSV